ncbi:vitellogenin-1-like [Musca vetustissima]|uniref:vitellogenin-1-like n=1 Tax=Musca vetustissima TaxID=27455 RepID=UPI002AB794E1|nr:vitellogenin-1-like [Musca vetustissima]
MLFKVLNQLCSLYVGSDNIDPRITPKLNEMYLQLRTPCSNRSVPLSEAQKLLEYPEFNATKRVVVFITGWMSSIQADYIEDMARAFHCRGNYNFLALNASNFVQTLYTWSAFNTDAVGAFVGKGIAKLSKKIPAKKIHLIGHSLGAHIAGKAGRHFQKLTGQTLARITGLDPANPCFNEGETLSGLHRGDAVFVDVIHSNPGVLGKSQPLGDVDFYPGGLAPIKPGCVIFSCSHSRAYEYFIETVFPGNERNFLAKRCNSLTSYNAGQCGGLEYPMGIATPTYLKGDYFLAVNAREPFGKNATRLTVNEKHSQCGRCSK